MKPSSYLLFAFSFLVLCSFCVLRLFVYFLCFSSALFVYCFSFFSFFCFLLSISSSFACLLPEFFLLCLFILYFLRRLFVFREHLCLFTVVVNLLTFR